jgi:tetratricopeptide (TPR) repeat protein
MGHSKDHRSDFVAYALHDEAQRALERALQLPAVHRKERLIELTKKYPSHGPTWLALAEEHAAGGRNEEASAALRRALRVDLSLRSDVSHALRVAAPHVLDEAAATAREAEKKPDAGPAPAAAAAVDRGGTDPQARAALEQAMKLPAERRCDHLAELALRYPGHAPIWLALAEEHLAGSRVEYAVSAYERALSLDAALQAVAPRKLEALRLYHRKVRIDAPGKMERSVPASPWMAARKAAPAASPLPAPRTRARGTTPPPVAPWSDPRHGDAPVPGISDASVHAVLARTLEIPDREQRLAALRTLETKAPDAPSVLFHLALELALAGQNDAARQVGDRLMKISPAYYRRLYEVAERHWPADQRRLAGAGAKSLAATKMIELPAAVVDVPAVPQPQPQPMAAQRTKRLPGLDAQGAAAVQAQGAAYRPTVPAAAQAYATALLALPPPPPQRASVGMRTIGFLAAGVFMGVLLVVLLNWLLPREPGTMAPQRRADSALAVVAPTLGSPLESRLGSLLGAPRASLPVPSRR